MVYIVRYGEISTKGKNRAYFEKKLVRNIKLQLKNKFEKIERLRGRILVYSDENLDDLKNIFGIVSFSKAFEVELNLDDIKKKALSLYKKGTFRISTSRLEKNFELSSQEINEQVGEYIIKNKDVKVNLKNPDTEIFIELFNGKSYIFDNKIKCLRGLPISVSGKVNVIAENDDSLVAAFLMMKRGCSVCFIKKNKIDIDKLKKFYPYNLEVLNKAEDVIVTSETLDNLNEDINNKDVLKPLLGYQRDEIEKIKSLFN